MPCSEMANHGLWRFDDGMPLAVSVSTSQALPTVRFAAAESVGPLTRNDGSTG